MKQCRKLYQTISRCNSNKMENIGAIPAVHIRIRISAPVNSIWIKWLTGCG